MLSYFYVLFPTFILSLKGKSFIFSTIRWKGQYSLLKFILQGKKWKRSRKSVFKIIYLTIWSAKL